MPMILRLLLLCSVLGSCTIVEDIDLRSYMESSGLQFSKGDAPDDAQPIGLIAVEDNGWYLLGFIPIVAVDMETCADRFVARAKRMRADGISNITISYRPAHALRLLTIGIPEWSASIAMTGMAYQMPDPKPARPLR